MGRARRGYVLIGVLAALVLAGTLASAYALAARRGAQTVRAEIDRARAQSLARGGAIQAAKMLAAAMNKGGVVGSLGGGRISPQIPGLPAFPPEMANAGGFLGQIARRMQELERLQAEAQGRSLDERRSGVGAGEPGPRPDGAPGSGRPEAPPPPALTLEPLRIQIGGESVEIALECEHGKLDVNEAPREALLGLLTALGESEAGAEGLLDAIEAYRISLSGARSADRRFESVGFRRRPLRGQKLDRLEALLDVPGFSTALYERVVPHLTTMGRREVDPNYASREVWKALGVRDDRALDRLEDVRRREPRLTREALLGALGAAVFGSLEDMISDSTSPVFTVRATAPLGGATGRSLIRLGLDEAGVPRALECRDGWL